MNASEQAAELEELLVLVRDSKTAIYATGEPVHTVLDTSRMRINPRSPFTVASLALLL
jgi:hypothetical protein